jgi:hypothetical protein
MRKLKLSLDALQVESFHAVDPDADGRGTVAAHSDPADCVSPWGTCEKWCTDGSCDSCQGSCFGTCGASCFNTCAATCLASCGCTGYTECNCATWETCLGAHECA